jgi:hypothetical protein
MSSDITESSSSVMSLVGMSFSKVAIARISSSIFLEMSTTIFELEKIFYGTFGVEHLEIVRYKIVKNIIKVLDLGWSLVL